MSNEKSEAILSSLKTLYEEVCRAHDGIADFRAKLLAFLPLASGTGIFFLLTASKNLNFEFLLPVGIFGCLVTFGLYLYELRGIQRCNILTKCGKQLEEKLLPHPNGLSTFSSEPEATFGFVGNTWAARIIYSTVLGGWAFVATSSKIDDSSNFNDPINFVIPLVVFIFGVVFGFIVNIRQKQNKKEPSNSKTTGNENEKLKRYVRKLQISIVLMLILIFLLILLIIYFKTV